MEYVGGIDVVEFLLEVVKADDGTGSVCFVGSDAAERNYILDACVFYGSRDGIADTLLVSERVGAGGIGWNHDIGRVSVVESFGDGG